jgi:hypothetical protein
MNSCLFSKIEKDQKSYGLIVSYLTKFTNGESEKDIENYGRVLQYEEIERHNILHGRAPHDPIESNMWIAANGQKYQNYLNAIKIVAMILEDRLESDPGIKINESYVFDVIEKYDSRLQAHLAFIR